MTIKPVFIYLCFLSVLSAAAQGVDDNVHIVNCVDRYKFKVNSDGIPVISNTMDLEYGVTKYAALVQPNVYYGDFIRLDKASSKGTAQYKSATPENIFFDGTKVCYFNYRIPKVGKTLKASFARTFTDAVYFTRISFPEDYYVENKTVQVVIPKALSQYHLKECNLPADVVKTAVADEAGDCIDVFSLDQIDTQEQQLDPFVFFLRQSEPVLYSRIHCVLDQSLATVYRSMNGAPEFKQTTDKDKNAVLDLTMDQPVDAEPSVWYNATVQSPYIMMFITPTKTKTVIVEKAMRKKGVRANPDVAPILQDDWKLMKTYVSKNGYSPIGLSGKYTRVFKALKKADVSAEEKADRISSLEYTCAGTSQESFNVVPNYLRKLGVELEMGITTPLGELPVDQLINYNSTTWFFRLKGTDLYYFPGVYPKVASEIPFIYQGRKAYMQDAEAPFEIPVSKASDNRSVVSVKASLDGTKMNISRRVVYSGEQKMFGQSVCSPEVSLYGPDHLEAYWRYLKYDDSDPYCVFPKKDASNIKAAFAEYKQKEQADQFKKEVAGYHESDPVKVSGYGVDCVGIRKDSADFVYHVDYEMEGLVKRAGSSMMLAVGKLIGEQMKLEGNDRIRKDRIWRRMAFADEWNIEVALPKGYQASAESLKKLNTTVSNDCGEFAVKASAGAGKIIVHVSKSFLHREEPVANWDKVLKLVDACSAFNEKQVVITKK